MVNLSTVHEILWFCIDDYERKEHSFTNSKVYKQKMSIFWSSNIYYTFFVTTIRNYLNSKTAFLISWKVQIKRRQVFQTQTAQKFLLLQLLYFLFSFLFYNFHPMFPNLFQNSFKIGFAGIVFILPQLHNLDYLLFFIFGTKRTYFIND